MVEYARLFSYLFPHSLNPLHLKHIIIFVSSGVPHFIQQNLDADSNVKSFKHSAQVVQGKRNFIFPKYNDGYR